MRHTVVSRLHQTSGRMSIEFNIRQSMKKLILTLDAAKLKNPDLDLRYVIPDLLTESSNGNIKDNGYDYEEQENPNSPLIAIFLTVTNLPAALENISQLVLSEEVLGNKLASATTLYIEENGCRTQVLFDEALRCVQG